MRKFQPNKLPGLILIVLILILIEILARTNYINPSFTPPPSKVVEALWGLASDGGLFYHLGFTSMRAATGFAIAMAIAIPLGVAMGEFKPLFYTFEPLVELLRPMPSAAMIPVAILLLGIGEEMRIAVIIFGALWPTIVSTIDSTRRVDSVLIDTGRTLNLSRRQIIWKIVVPSAAPGIATGMRISLAIALILTITVEMVAGSTGMGFFIIDTERASLFPEMFAGIVAVGVLGYAVNWIFVGLERRSLRWHQELVARER